MCTSKMRTLTLSDGGVFWFPAENVALYEGFRWINTLWITFQIWEIWNTTCRNLMQVQIKSISFLFGIIRWAALARFKVQHCRWKWSWNMRRQPLTVPKRLTTMHLPNGYCADFLSTMHQRIRYTTSIFRTLASRKPWRQRLLQNLISFPFDLHSPFPANLLSPSCSHQMSQVYTTIGYSFQSREPQASICWTGQVENLDIKSLWALICYQQFCVYC